MKFFMAQNESGDLRIASSENNTTLDGDGWYKINSVNNFENIEKSEDEPTPPIHVYGQEIKQLTIPSWQDNRKWREPQQQRIHLPCCYFLYNYNRGIYSISEIIPTSYNGQKIKEAYRLLTNTSNNIDGKEYLQYIDYSDTEHVNKLIQKTYTTMPSSIVIANNESDNLNNILIGQDLFFQIEISKQGSYEEKFQFDFKLYGYKTESDYNDQTKKEEELFSTELFAITSSSPGSSLTINKLISISDIIVKYYKITKVIVQKNKPTSTTSSLKNFYCYLPYFTWVNVPIQIKTISGYYLQNM